MTHPNSPHLITDPSAFRLADHATRVDDIEAAIKTAEDKGAEFAMKATEIPGRGTFAIYFQGGAQYELWQN